MRSVLMSMTARLRAEPLYLALSVFLTAIFVVIGIVITTTDGAALYAAYSGPEAMMPEDSAYLEIEHRDEPPAKSALVMGHYDASIVYTDEGYEVVSLTNEDVAAIIGAILAGEDVSEFFATDESPAIRIVGITMMIIMMQAIFYLDFLIEDRQARTLKRMASSPLKLRTYLTGIVLYAVLVVGLIALATLFFAGTVFNRDIGMSLGAYAWVYFLALCFGVSLALLLVSAIDIRDNAAALFALLIITTTLLSGAFIPYETDNALLEFFIRAMPQHNIMEATEKIIAGNRLNAEVGIVLAMSALLFVASGVVVKKKMSLGKY